jgi:hypothetical protein
MHIVSKFKIKNLTVIKHDKCQVGANLASKLFMGCVNKLEPKLLVMLNKKSILSF